MSIYCGFPFAIYSIGSLNGEYNRRCAVSCLLYTSFKLFLTSSALIFLISNWAFCASARFRYNVIVPKKTFVFFCSKTSPNSSVKLYANIVACVVVACSYGCWVMCLYIFPMCAINWRCQTNFFRSHNVINLNNY